MTREVVFVGAARTAIGTFGGSLKDVPPADLGALVIKTALEREPSAIIPHAPKVFAGSEAAGKGPATAKGGEDVQKLLLDIAARACGAMAKEAGEAEKKDGPFSFLKKMGKSKDK